MKTFAAVVQLETDLLNPLSPLEQACAIKLMETRPRRHRGDAPRCRAGGDPHRMEMARDVAAKIEEADTQAEIVKAHGRTKAGFGGRDLKEMSLARSACSRAGADRRGDPRGEREGAEGRQDRPRRRASASTTARARPGWSGWRRSTVEMAKALGVPVHDGATGRRIG